MSDLTFERRLLGRPADVIACFTDADRMTRWFWPPRLAPEVTVDAVVGGSWRVVSPVAEMAVGGTFLSVAADELVLTWQWGGEPEATTVTVAVAATNPGTAGESATALRIEHHGFADDTSRDEHIQGWNDCLERLPGELGR